MFLVRSTFLGIEHCFYSTDKHLISLSSLLERFKVLLPDDASSENYRSSKLQRRLQNHCKDEIIIQSQRGQGKSNIIKSSKITADDTVRAAQQ